MASHVIQWVDNGLRLFFLKATQIDVREGQHSLYIVSSWPARARVLAAVSFGILWQVYSCQHYQNKSRSLRQFFNFKNCTNIQTILWQCHWSMAQWVCNWSCPSLSKRHHQNIFFGRQKTSLVRRRWPWYFRLEVLQLVGDPPSRAIDFYKWNNWWPFPKKMRVNHICIIWMMIWLDVCTTSIYPHLSFFASRNGGCLAQQK